MKLSDFKSFAIKFHCFIFAYTYRYLVNIIIGLHTSQTYGYRFSEERVKCKMEYRLSINLSKKYLIEFLSILTGSILCGIGKMEMKLHIF